MNFNYFLAISARVNVNGKFRYFLGLVQEQNKKFTMKILEKDEYLFAIKYSMSSVRRYHICALPSKKAVKDFRQALNEYFKTSKSLVGFLMYEMGIQFPDVDIKNIDRFEYLIGEVSK